MAYEDENTYNLVAYIAHQIYKSDQRMFFVFIDWFKLKLTVELSDRLVIDDRPVFVALSFGDDAGVAVECKYGQSDRVHAPAKRHGGWIYKHSLP
jgi:hypothetical protein